jgi:CheY-like chemotaxis protein
MPTPSSKRLLIIDDSEDLQILLKRVFESKGYEVLMALNGKEALRILFAGHSLPDLILLDVILPDMRGEDFAKIKEKNVKLRNIPIILMSAGVTHLSEMEQEFHIKGYLTKPLDLKNLLSTVEHAFA